MVNVWKTKMFHITLAKHAAILAKKRLINADENRTFRWHKASINAIHHTQKDGDWYIYL